MHQPQRAECNIRMGVAYKNRVLAAQRRERADKYFRLGESPLDEYSIPGADEIERHVRHQCRIQGYRGTLLEWILGHCNPIARDLAGRGRSQAQRLGSTMAPPANTPRTASQQCGLVGAKIQAPCIQPGEQLDFAAAHESGRRYRAAKRIDVDETVPRLRQVRMSNGSTLVEDPHRHKPGAG